MLVLGLVLVLVLELVIRVSFSVNSNPNPNPNPNLALRLTTRFQSFLGTYIIGSTTADQGWSRLIRRIKGKCKSKSLVSKMASGTYKKKAPKGALLEKAS